MAHASTRRRPAAAFGLTVAGGALVVLGTFLVWFRSPGAENDTVRGVELFVGRLALALGLLIAVCGALILVMDTRLGRMTVGIAGLALAAVAAWFCLYAASAPLDAFAGFVAGEAGAGAGAAGDIERTLRQNGIQISAGVGAWLASAGSLIAMAGSVAGIVAGGRVRTAAPSRAQRAGCGRTQGA